MRLIVKDLTPAFMSLYFVALIRFSKNGRSYPVNCAEPLEPGTRVIVRMAGQQQELQRAEVVSTFDSERPCRNTIVCLEEEAEAYGEGPPGVKNADDLDRFLTFLGWDRYATLQRDRSGRAEALPYDEWPVAYARKSLRNLYSPGKNLRGPGIVIVVGPQGTGLFPLRNDMHRAEILDGKLVIDSFILTLGKESLKSEQGLTWKDVHPHYHAAKKAERDLVTDLSPPDYSGLGNTRGELTGGAGGPVYLSDDVWL
ncbi:MAG: hypothetical protein E5V54_31760 [Mesorhizobium sp.]|nr:MAG: hypothetical protein E5V54_31760 [Mesorhizobium sp.]